MLSKTLAAGLLAACLATLAACGAEKPVTPAAAPTPSASASITPASPSTEAIPTLPPDEQQAKCDEILKVATTGNNSEADRETMVKVLTLSKDMVGEGCAARLEEAFAKTGSTATVFKKSDYKKLSSRSFKKLAKDPDAYSGKKYVIYGEVIQFDSNTGSDALRASTGPDKKAKNYGFFGYDENTTLTGTKKLLADVVEGDAFEAFVTITGSYSYSTTIGGTATALQATVEKIRVYDSKD